MALIQTSPGAHVHLPPTPYSPWKDEPPSGPFSLFHWSSESGLALCLLREMDEDGAVRTVHQTVSHEIQPQCQLAPRLGFHICAIEWAVGQKE